MAERGGHGCGRAGGPERLGGRAAGPVDVHETRELIGSGLPVEVPRGISRDDRAAEGVPTEDDLATELLGRADHGVQVLDGDVHSPVLGELDARVRDHLKVVRDRRVLDVAEVVVEELGGGGLPLLEEVQL